MRVRVIVADQSEARFYDISAEEEPLQPAGRIVDPDAQGREQELESERSARGYDRGAFTARVAVAPHSGGAAMRFARQIAAELDASLRREGFDRSVLMAGPAFIGLLRSALSGPVRATLMEEVRKDLVHEDDETIHAFVPPEVFR
jgi:protein required for attachment to host cells